MAAANGGAPPVDILVSDGTLSGAIKACRALMDGHTVEKAAAAAGVTDRTLRNWRKEPWWPQIRLIVEAELRDSLLGASLRLLRKRVVEDEDDRTATFLVKLFLVDTVGRGAGRPSKAEDAGVKGGGGLPSGLTPEQAVAILEQAEET